MFELLLYRLVAFLPPMDRARQYGLSRGVDETGVSHVNKTIAATCWDTLDC